MIKFILGLISIITGCYIAFILSNQSSSFLDTIDKKIEITQLKLSGANLAWPQGESISKEEKGIQTALERYGEDAEKDIKLKSLLLKELKIYKQCLQTESCFSVEEGFYNKSMDPVFQKIKKLLDRMDTISDEDDKFLEMVNIEELLKFLGHGNEVIYKQVSVMAYKKGSSSVRAVGDELKNKQSPFLGEFIVELSSSNLIEEQEIKKFRNSLVAFIFDSRNSVLVSSLPKVLNKIHFEREEILLIKNKYCNLELAENNEIQLIFKSKFVDFFKKYRLSDKC